MRLASPASLSSLVILVLLVGCAGAPDRPGEPPQPSEPSAPTPVVASRAGGDDPPEDRIVPGVGYADTPRLPDSRYLVHDGNRPQPRVVKVGDLPSVGSGAAPSDATILFDGNGLDRWTGSSGPAGWKLVGEAMEVNGTGSITTRDEYGDIQLHLEFRTPEPRGDSQGRGNSGVFLMGRYEVQILDSWDNPTYPDGQSGSLYGQKPPLVNASLPPGQWQTYDLVFRAPRFDEDGSVRTPARVTLFHNGICVHHDQPFLGPTRHRALTEYAPHPGRGPIQLQDHGNPIRFRNIWVRELRGYDE